MRIPKALEPGARVALTCPASPPLDGSIEKAKRYLEALGLQVVVGASCLYGSGYLAGTPELRAEELQHFFEDPTIGGILAAKGGYGSVQIVDALDYDTIKQHPKIFLGYSDITTLHLALGRYADLETYHGPMPTTEWIRRDFDEGSRHSLLQTILAPPEPIDIVVATCRIPRSGRARGILTGGNLALLAASIGTPYALETRGRLLLIEDVDEAPYRIDRMLWQLKLAGVFKEVAGVLFGPFTRCEDGGEISVDDVLDAFIEELDCPVVKDFPAGHELPALTLPMGRVLTLEADERKVRLFEDPMCDSSTDRDIT